LDSLGRCRGKLGVNKLPGDGAVAGYSKPRFCGEMLAGGEGDWYCRRGSREADEEGHEGVIAGRSVDG